MLVFEIQFVEVSVSHKKKKSYITRFSDIDCNCDIDPSSHRWNLRSQDRKFCAITYFEQFNFHCLCSCLSNPGNYGFSVYHISYFYDSELTVVLDPQG